VSGLAPGPDTAAGPGEAPPPSRPALLARGLTKRFGDFEAVKGIDFSAPEHTCFGFLGPNGAGKTTTMRMISCISPPTSGILEILGMPVGGDARAIRARMGVVPQENNLDNEVSVIENLVIYARYYGIGHRQSRPRAEELLGFVALADRRDWSVRKLSGGMKRRLLIARALMPDPELLVLDEPTTGLDPQARHLVWEKLRSLRRQGVTLVLTTHYMEEAAQLCDRLVIMHEGRILVEGSPRELVAQEASPYVVEVIDPPEELYPELEALAAVADRGERTFDRWLYYTTDGEALLARLRRLPIDPSSVWLRGATLEDVFLARTGRGLRE
jgi:lipooligosaccharide transport system ATP-binding protein